MRKGPQESKQSWKKFSTKLLLFNRFSYSSKPTADFKPNAWWKTSNWEYKWSAKATNALAERFRAASPTFRCSLCSRRDSRRGNRPGSTALSSSTALRMLRRSRGRGQAASGCSRPRRLPPRRAALIPQRRRAGAGGHAGSGAAATAASTRLPVRLRNHGRRHGCRCRPAPPPRQQRGGARRKAVCSVLCGAAVIFTLYFLMLMLKRLHLVTWREEIEAAQPTTAI